MALAETANLVVKLSLGGNFTSQIGKATAGLGKLEKGSSRAFKAGSQIGTGIKNAGKIAAVGIGVLVSQVALGLDSLVKLEKAEAQTAAVLKSTGGAAGINGAQVTALAEKYEGLNAIVGDEFIRAGENMLLTFTRIKGKAFEPALAAALDLNTALGKGPEGLTKTVTLVGKALNDPTKGLTALTRVGVAFSKGQVKRIKSLQKEGKLYEAQQIILGELNKEFGGSFIAQGDTTAGSVAKFGDAIEDLQRSLATALLPTVRNVADSLTKFLADPAVVQGAKDLGVAIAGVFTKERIGGGIAALGSVVSTIRGAMPAIVSAASAIGSVVGTAVNLFNTLPPELKTLLVAGVGVNKLTGGLVTNVAGGIVGAILGQLKSAHVSVTGAVVQVNGPVAGGGVPGAGAAGAAGAGLSTVGKVFLVGEAIGLALLVNEVRSGIESETTKIATAVGVASDAQIAHNPSRAELTQGLAGVEAGIKQLESDPIGTALIAGDALAELKRIRSNTQRALNDLGANGRDSTTQAETTKGNVFGPNGLGQSITEAQRAAADKVTTSVESMRGRIADELATTQDKIGTGAIKTATAAIGAGVAASMASRSAGGSIVSAIQANRPIITVNVSATTVNRVVQVTQRYGNPNSSRNQGNTTEGGMGGH